MPSLPNAMREALPDGIAEKRSCHSTSAAPSHRARASVIVPGAPPGPGAGAAPAGRLVVREVDELVLGEARMKRDVHQAGKAGRLHGGQAATGVGSSTPLRTIRRRPGRSVTRIPPSGRNAMLHGWLRPLVTTSRI